MSKIEEDVYGKMLVYKNLRIDLDYNSPIIVQLQNVLHDIADGRINDEYDGFHVHTHQNNSLQCSACHAFYGIEIYTVTARGGGLQRWLCKDCAEGVADALEDYINNNVGDLLGESL